MHISRRCRIHMVVGFITTYAMQSVSLTNKVMNSNPAHGKVYSILLHANVIKLVSDLRYVGGFLQYNCNIVESGVKRHSHIYFPYILFIREKFWSSRMNLCILYIHCYLYNNINAYSQIFLRATAIYKLQIISILIKLIHNCETCVNSV